MIRRALSSSAVLTDSRVAFELSAGEAALAPMVGELVAFQVWLIEKLFAGVRHPDGSFSERTAELLGGDGERCRRGLDLEGFEWVWTSIRPAVFWPMLEERRAVYGGARLGVEQWDTHEIKDTAADRCSERLCAIATDGKQWQNIFPDATNLIRRSVEYPLLHWLALSEDPTMLRASNRR